MQLCKRSAAIQVNTNRVARPVRPRVCTVRPRAGLKDAGDFVSQAFLRIFTTPEDNGVDWKGTTTPFKGRIAHGKRVSYDSVPQGAATGSKNKSEPSTTLTHDNMTAALDKDKQPTSETVGLATYVAGALQRLIGHNFKGDETEPDWKQSGNNWSGKIHTRDSDGFHSKKL